LKPIWGVLVLISIGNLDIPIPIVSIVTIIIIILNTELIKLDMKQAGNSVEVYFSIKYALISIVILLLYIFNCMEKIKIL